MRTVSLTAFTISAQIRPMIVCLWPFANLRLTTSAAPIPDPVPIPLRCRRTIRTSDVSGNSTNKSRNVVSLDEVKYGDKEALMTAKVLGTRGVAEGDWSCWG